MPILKMIRGIIVTRNGYLPEREIQTGIGHVPAKAPLIRDRQHEALNRQRIQFSVQHSVALPFSLPVLDFIWNRWPEFSGIGGQFERNTHAINKFD